MRHRRRLNTQTLRKKQQPGTYTQINRPKPKRSTGSAFKIIFYLMVISALVYAGYHYKDNFKNLLETEFTQAPENNEASFPIQEPNNGSAKANETQELTPIQKKVQLEILNGCGEQGIAKILADRLIAKNYDVVNSGNYIENGKTFFGVSETKIIDQLKTTANLVKAKELADYIGISTKLVDSIENPSPIADITVVIGNDFKTLPVFKKD